MPYPFRGINLIWLTEKIGAQLQVGDNCSTITIALGFYRFPSQLSTNCHELLQTLFYQITMSDEMKEIIIAAFNVKTS